MGVWVIIAIVLAILLGCALVYFWGFLVNCVLPFRPSAVGDKVHIFLGGVYNREATITSIGQESVTIYDTLPLPLGYRAKFYAVGYDRDGVEFWYMADKRLYWLVPFAEKIRKRYKLIDCPFNFVPVEQPLEQAVAGKEGEQEEAAQEEGSKETAAEEGTADEN